MLIIAVSSLIRMSFEAYLSLTLSDQGSLPPYFSPYFWLFVPFFLVFVLVEFFLSTNYFYTGDLIWELSLLLRHFDMANFCLEINILMCEWLNVCLADSNILSVRRWQSLGCWGFEDVHDICQFECTATAFAFIIFPKVLRLKSILRSVHCF